MRYNRTCSTCFHSIAFRCVPFHSIYICIDIALHCYCVNVMQWSGVPAPTHDVCDPPPPLMLHKHNRSRRAAASPASRPKRTSAPSLPRRAVTARPAVARRPRRPRRCQRTNTPSRTRAAPAARPRRRAWMTRRSVERTWYIRIGSPTH